MASQLAASRTPLTLGQERPDDEEPTQRVAQRTKQEASESMVDILTNDLWSDDVVVLRKAMTNLKATLFDEDDKISKESQKEFFQLGGHATVVRLMKEHLACKLVQYYSLLVLANAVYMTSDSCRIVLGKVKGIEAIVAAMKRYPLDAGIQLRGLLCLHNMMNEANAHVLVTTLNKSAFIVQRMKAFMGRGDDNVVQAACILLKSLSRFEVLRKHLVKAKAVTALGAIFESDKFSVETKRSAHEALNLLTSV